MAAVAEISESEVREPSPKRPKIEGNYGGGDDDDGESSGLVCVDTYSESDDDTDPEKVRMRKEYADYQDQYAKTEGFGIDVRCELPFAIGLTYPLDLSREESPLVQLAKGCTDFAIEKENPNLTDVKILRTTFCNCGGYLFKITFEAKDSTSGNKNIYQAQVHDLPKGMEVEFLRPKPKHHDYV